MGSKQANYRIYDLTGGGVQHDIYAKDLDEAVRLGKEWIEGGDWGDDNEVESELYCVVRPIVRDENGDVDSDATADGDETDCSGTMPVREPECAEAEEHDWATVGEPHASFGAGLIYREKCTACGLNRVVDTGAVDRGNGRPATRIVYE